MSLISNNSANNFTLTSSNTVYVNQSIPRQITINPVANGYSISIGCQTFVFESMVSMLSRIEEYYNNPSEVEEYFNEHKKLPNK
jgi:hypothetical protein